jgi:hypothetical protein
VIDSNSPGDAQRSAMFSFRNRRALVRSVLQFSRIGESPKPLRSNSLRNSLTTLRPPLISALYRFRFKECDGYRVLVTTQCHCSSALESVFWIDGKAALLQSRSVPCERSSSNSSWTVLGRRIALTSLEIRCFRSRPSLGADESNSDRY